VFEQSNDNALIQITATILKLYLSTTLLSVIIESEWNILHHVMFHC